jgi:hypothetical protein
MDINKFHCIDVVEGLKTLESDVENIVIIDRSKKSTKS